MVTPFGFFTRSLHYFLKLFNFSNQKISANQKLDNFDLVVNVENQIK